MPTDTIEDRLTTSAADGLNGVPPILLASFCTSASEVVPILRRRNLFRTNCEGTTLRKHYGLARPASQLFDIEAGMRAA